MLIIAFIFVETGTQDNKRNLLPTTGDYKYFLNTSQMVKIIVSLLTLFYVAGNESQWSD